MALSAKNGRLIWKQQLPGKAKAPLVVLGGRVVCITRGARPQAVALSAASGRRLWNRRLAGPVSLAAAGGKLWLVGQSGVAERSLYGGRLLWRTAIPGLTNPSPPTLADGTLYFGGGNQNRWYGLDLATRRLAWTLSLPAMVRSGVAAAGRHTLYIPGLTREPGGTALSLVAVAETDGRVLWRRPLGAAGPVGGIGLPVLFGPACYVASPGTDLVYAVERAGGRLLWQDALNQATLATVPLAVAGQLVIGDQQGRLWDLSAATGHVVAAVRLPAPIPPQMPYVVGRTLYATVAGADGALLALQMGRIVPALARGHPIPVAF